MSLITQKHFYTISGLLDSTERQEVYYGNGKPAATLNFTIARQYDKRNLLISERKFEIVDNGKELSEENSFGYDDRNNLVLKVEKFHGVLWEMVKTTYNKLNQKTEKVLISERANSTPPYFNDKNPVYDTLKVSYEYDEEGNLKKELYPKETLTTLYSNGLKSFTYGLDSKGDTLTAISYKQQGNLTTKATRFKANPSYIEQEVYDGDKILEQLSIDSTRHYKHRETHKYDDRGSQIEEISYK